MTWFRVDDKLHDHPKLRRLKADKLPALGLWTACGSWSGDNLTDGFVPSEIVQRFDPNEGLAKRLVDVGLWVQVELDEEPGYLFHQWVEHQPSKAEVERKRAEARERMRKRRAGTSTEPDGTDDSSSQEVRANTSGSAEEVRHPDPTRPVPKEEKISSRPEPRREDVHDLCKHLQDRLIANKCKPPTAATAEAWRREARLMLDKDKRDLAQAHQLIDWSTNHYFWKSKVLGMPKFRQQYDQLRLQAQEEGGLRHLNSVPADRPDLGTFEDYALAHAAREAAQLIRKPYVPDPKPPSDKTSHQVWEQQQADRWLEAHAAEIRAALTRKETA